MERHEVAPVRIGLERLVGPEDGTPTIRATQEDVREAPGEVIRYLPQGLFRSGSGRALHEEVAAVVLVELLERFDEWSSISATGLSPFAPGAHVTVSSSGPVRVLYHVADGPRPTPLRTWLLRSDQLLAPP